MPNRGASPFTYFYVMWEERKYDMRSVIYHD